MENIESQAEKQEKKHDKYAIIQSGSKQYRVMEGDVVDVDLLDAEEGAVVNFENVLFASYGKKTTVGNPNVAGFLVKGQVIGQAVGPKITSVKYKARHNDRRKFGHRQKYTRVKITSLAFS